MHLSTEIDFGTVLPHRSSRALDGEEIKTVARRAEALGFRDLWVTENTLDDAFSLDPFVALTFAAAVTQSIRLGVSVVVLPTHSPIHLAHRAASLDYLSKGRAILGVGLGRPDEYRDFQVPMERRVRRFKEGIALMKALWTQERVNYQGDIYSLADAGIALKPCQKPHLPLWLGGAHPDAIGRAAALGDGWMGGGAQTREDFARLVPKLHEALAALGKDTSTFRISKRVFVSVHKDRKVAESKVQQWFRDVYRKPELSDSAGIYGTGDEVREKLKWYISAGANHLLLNSVGDYLEQVEALAEVVNR